MGLIVKKSSNVFKSVPSPWSATCFNAHPIAYCNQRTSLTILYYSYRIIVICSSSLATLRCSKYAVLPYCKSDETYREDILYLAYCTEYSMSLRLHQGNHESTIYLAIFFRSDSRFFPLVMPM